MTSAALTAAAEVHRPPSVVFPRGAQSSTSCARQAQQLLASGLETCPALSNTGQCQSSLRVWGHMGQMLLVVSRRLNNALVRPSYPALQHSLPNGNGSDSAHARYTWHSLLTPPPHLLGYGGSCAGRRRSHLASCSRQNVLSAAQLGLSACPCPHSAMQNTCLQQGIRQPCRQATQQCSAVQNVTALPPKLSSAAQPSMPACSCSPSAMHHTRPQHYIAEPCGCAKQHAWRPQPGLPEAVAAHVVSHDAALLGHPLVSSAG